MLYKIFNTILNNHNAIKIILLQEQKVCTFLNDHCNFRKIIILQIISKTENNSYIYIYKTNGNIVYVLYSQCKQKRKIKRLKKQRKISLANEMN